MNPILVASDTHSHLRQNASGMWQVCSKSLLDSTQTGSKFRHYPEEILDYGLKQKKTSPTIPTTNIIEEKFILDSSTNLTRQEPVEQLEGAHCQKHEVAGACL